MRPGYNSLFLIPGYKYDWQLIIHPHDYMGEMEGQQLSTLKLSKVSIKK